MAAMGPDGMAQAAGSPWPRPTIWQGLCAVAGVELRYDGEYFHEFVSPSAGAGKRLAALAEGDILGGLPIGEGGVLWCATEKVSRAQLDKAVSIVKEVLAK